MQQFRRAEGVGSTRPRQMKLFATWTRFEKCCYALLRVLKEDDRAIPFSNYSAVNSGTTFAIMGKHCAIIIGLSCFVRGAALTGQESEGVMQLDARVSDFFENLRDEQVGPEKAFADLLAGGPLEKSVKVKTLIDRSNKLAELYGAFVTAERIAAKEVGKDLVLLKYLHKAERYPVIWYFTYYRPPSTVGDEKEWMVIAVRFDTRLDLLGL
jgi:hypothetical protein